MIFDFVDAPLTITIEQFLACVSLLIGTNGKPLAAIGKFLSAIGKLMIGETFATNGDEITNTMIDNDVLANYW